MILCTERETRYMGSTERVDPLRRLRSELKRQRLLNGMTLEMVAKRLDTAPSQVSRIERGDITNPSLPDILEMARIYGMSGDEVFELAGYAPRKEPKQDPRLRRICSEVQALPRTEREEMITQFSRMLIGRRHEEETRS